MKVRMYPHLDELGKGESGIHTVIRKYFEYLPPLGINLVDKDVTVYDLLVVHAGMMANVPRDMPMVAMLHGLYWTADYQATRHEYIGNANIVTALRYSDQITVPSSWVAETIKRDMRLSPTIVPHGVDWENWDNNLPKKKAVLAYSKNRAYFDVCDPNFIPELAKRFPEITFYTTFAPRKLGLPSNVEVTGLLPHDEFKHLVQQCMVAVSPIKETWGIFTAEALAAGVPVLGTNRGGNTDIVQHGVNGYLYVDYNMDDMEQGLRYCLDNHTILAENAKIRGREFDWQKSAQIIKSVFDNAMIKEKPTSSVIIPYYKQPEDVLNRAVGSVVNQTHTVSEIIIVDDGSEMTDVIYNVTNNYGDYPITVLTKENGGVASARNMGGRHATTKYITFLDPDDHIAPRFLEVCIDAMEFDKGLHLAYTKLLTVHPNGAEEVSAWPDEWDFDRQMLKKNQVPTCNVMRKKTFMRLGGYRSRYCPSGAGTEDAHLWSLFGIHGFKCELVSTEPLFIYSFKQGHTSQEGYSEVDWLSLIPESKDREHKLASYASPSSPYSHGVRQHDEPEISIVVPVGGDHEKYLRNLFETIEGQTFRKWELIVVNDTGDKFDDWLYTAFPFVKWIETEGKTGAGHARNLGVEHAKGKFLLFIDADDNLVGAEALQEFHSEFMLSNGIIYSDYYSITKTDDPKSLMELCKQDPFRSWIDWRERSQDAITHHTLGEFQCDIAMKQPDFERPYLWCNVTALMPKAWHNEIGGFDETMEAWEDWDYWLRLAHIGRCFHRVDKPLLAYRFYSGTRRDDGLQNKKNLLLYLQDKYKDVDKNMPCNCKDKKSSPQYPRSQYTESGLRTQATVAIEKESTDDDFFWALYDTGSRGQRPVVGMATRTNYYYRSTGDIFLVHKDDIALQKHIYKCPETGEEFVFDHEGNPRCRKVLVEHEQIPETKPPEPVIVKSIVLESIPGVNQNYFSILEASGLTTKNDIKEAGISGLTALKGIGEKTAVTILEGVENL